MRLKRLELYGFKSFYDKTTFEFSDGITAIVGPNGCGKSNIVDAIRWVLGEHAPSYLRTRQLEDVIFAGSEGAGPLGMAEVSVVFSNEDGGGPPGYESFSEIQVTRRTFRDGESEFLINRVPCRLRDIAELFLDTGAGSRGYAVVEQGRIMSLVNARPEENRLVLEEAAGVARFRARRKEAERKMESARQNLARVRDVHEEVRRQLAGLERQARRAERYRALREELRTLELSIAARKRRALAEQAARAEAERRAAEEELAGWRARLAMCEAEAQARRLALAEAEAELARLREAHAAGKEAVARREAEVAGKVREAQDLRRRAAEAEAEIVALGGEIAACEARMSEARSRLASREEAVAALKYRVGELSAAAAAARDRCRAAEERCERARADLMVRVSLQSNARSSADSLRRMLEESGRALERAQERLGEARAEAVRLEEEAAAAAERVARAREEVAAASAEWEALGRRLAEIDGGLGAAAEARRCAEGDLAAARSRLAVLWRLYGERDWASSGVKAVLRYYEEERGERPAEALLGVMGELVETEPAYEKAVEAALGDRVQSVVVRDHAAGLAALRRLKETREGRVSFVPVSLRRREEEAAWTGEEGVIAPMAELVRVPEGCEGLARGLFGGTLLVRDLECALRLWHRNGVWNSYVTLDGDVVTGDGVLMGGSPEAGGAGVLAGRREVRELEREIAALAGAADGARAEEEGLRRERSLVEARMAELVRARERLGEAQAEAEANHARAAEALARAASRAADLEREREHLAAERERLRAELADTEEAARRTEEDRDTEESRLRAFLAEVEAARKALRDLEEGCRAAQLDLAAAEQGEAADRALLRELGEMHQGRMAAREERLARRAAHAERARVLDAEIGAESASLEEDRRRLAAGQDEIERRMGEAAAERASLAAAEEAIREARRREAQEQERVTARRLEEQRAAMELAALDDDVFRRYEVVAADLPVPEGAGADGLEADEARAAEIRSRMAAMGEVNLGAIEEHRELLERHAFLSAQEADLEKSLDDLARAIQKIDRTSRERFAEAFERVNAAFGDLFVSLFQGGRAFLRLSEEDPAQPGVEIVAQPPGKKLQSLHLLSGGEKALTAIAFLFALFLVRPSPFCLLDEVDAPLDDANIDRFNALLRRLAADHQILIITHNKRTMELADLLYGITMEKPGVSKVVSVRFAA